MANPNIEVKISEVMDEYAISFAYWIQLYNINNPHCKKSITELLKIFKCQHK